MSIPSESIGTSSSSSLSSSTVGGNGSTIHRAADTAHRTIDTVADKAQHTYERVRGGVSDLRGRARESLDGLAVNRDQWVTNARETVREHPLATVAIALGVGWLVSRLLRDD